MLAVAKRELDRTVSMTVWCGLVLAMIKTCPKVKALARLSRPYQFYAPAEWLAWCRGELECESCLVWQLGFGNQCKKSM